MSYHAHAEAIDDRASGGVSVMVKKAIPHRQINVNGDLQAVAVSLSMHKTSILLTTDNWIICWNSCRLHLFNWAT